MGQDLLIEAPGLPRNISPMHPGGSSEPFDSTAHLFEVHWDGLRVLAFVERTGLRLLDQSGRDVTELFPELGLLTTRVKQPECVLDGVVVVSDSGGKPDFAALDRRMRLSSSDGVSQAAQRQPVAYIAFDLLFSEGRAVMGRSLLQRRKLLRQTLDADGRICISDAVAGEGIAFFEAACELGIEAVIAKRKDSAYVPGGKVPSWLLVQDVRRQDLVVLGYVPAEEVGFESLLLGVYDGGRATYAGAVGGGFDRRTERLLSQALPGLRGGAEPPERSDRVPPHAIWIRPDLVVSVKFSEWTADGMLRFPIFVGMHPEVDPRDCTRQPQVPPRPDRDAGGRRKDRKSVV